MKQLIFRICFLLLIGSQAYGQQIHFVYMQTENREPFYVMFNKKTISSSPIGYIIIPKLENGEYNIRIGFAKNTGAEQDYVIQVKDNEQGYLIKDFGEKGWALFNLHSLDLQYAGSINKQRINTAMLEAEATLKADEQVAENKRKAEALAAAEAKLKAEIEKVAIDKLAAEKLKQAETVVPDKTTEVAPKDLPVIVTLPKEVVPNKVFDTLQTAKPATIISEPVITVIIPKKEITSDSKLIAQIKTDSGFIYKYAVNNIESHDTVNVYIKSAPQLPIELPKNTMPKEPATVQPNTTKDPVKFLNMDFKQDSAKENSDLIVPVFKTPTPPEVKNYAENDTKDVVIKQPVKELPVAEVKKDSSLVVASVLQLPNSNCRAEADEKDFFNLRKKMASEDGADEMVMVAKKAMKEKCYSTMQVRNLSVLFLNDADRYQFLDAAYPFTHDAYQYNTLINLLYDNYYVQRFKAMIRK